MEQIIGSKRCLRRCLLEDPREQYDLPDGTTGAPDKRPALRRAPTFLIGFAVGAAAAGAAVYSRPLLDHPAALDLPAAPVTKALHFEATRAEETLGELSAGEVTAVARWFAAETGAVGTQNTSKSCKWISGPSGVELLRPPKAATLAYLDGKGPRPPRFARVTMVDEVSVQEYRVGPLEDGRPVAGARAEPLFKKGHVPRTKRPTEPHADADLAGPIINAALRDAAKPLVESFGPMFQSLEGHDPSAGTLDFYTRNDALTPAGLRQDLIIFLWIPPSSEPSEKFWMHPLPLGMHINMTDPDPAAWHVVDIHYCGQGPFESGMALGEAHRRGDVRVCPFPKSTGKWDYPQRFTPPSAVGLNPKEANSGVSWGPWTFTATQRPSTGLALLDVRFRGERVLYELALQDAYAGYSGDRSNQFFYADASWSLSMLSASLEPGVDCPEGAHYISAPNWYSIIIGGDANSDPLNPRKDFWPVCVFEQKESDTVWRHMDNTNPPKVNGLLRKSVIVRSIFTVANYDYICDVKLKEDGEIEVKASFAGYIEARYFDERFNPREKSFSTILRPGLAGPVHSHSLNVKADLDIAGVRANSLQLTRVKAGEIGSGGLLDGKPILTKYIERSFVEQEGVGKSTFVGDPGKPTVWSFVDRNATAPFGNPRGYSISLASFATTQVLPADHRFTRAVPYTKYHLAVTKYRDEEYRSSSPYVQYDIASAGVNGQNLDDFLSDGDSLMDEDLVAWVTIGKEHVVRQEDMPLVSNFGGGFSITPWNFLTQNAAASGPV